MTKKPHQKKPHQWMLAAALMVPVALVANSDRAQASDHADTAQNYNGGKSVADLTDLFIFPSPSNANNVVFVMNTYGLIPAGQGSTRSFGTDVLYQFRIATGRTIREDLVIQAKFDGTGPNQSVSIVGPTKPTNIGRTSVFQRAFSTRGTLNRTFQPTPGMKVFAGAREDPFFIDLERLFQIFPDRATPIQPPQPRRFDINTPEPNRPRLTSFRPPGEAKDFLANFNVLSIVIEMPKAMIRVGDGTEGNAAAEVIKVWMTTSTQDTPNGTASGTGNTGGPGVTTGTFTQQDRLARPVVNEVFAPVSFKRHEINNIIQPNDDPHQIGKEINSFMRNTAGRSQAIADVVSSVLTPDVMIADLSQSGPAAYLGVETAGATGGKFGGRKLQDDVVDISLGVIFGKTIPALGLAPDDGKEIPSLTRDNVGFGAKSFLRTLNTFPYLGNPR